MNNTPNAENQGDLDDDLLPEYNFDYQKARPNRFASPVLEERITVVLDSDVAQVFKTDSDVNQALRAIISAIPHGSMG